MNALRGLGLHFAIAWVMVIALLYLVGHYVPGVDRQIGSSYLIFYFHFPSAINCLNFFIFGGVMSGIYLWRKHSRWDHLGSAAIEVGVLACTVTLVTGSIWAKAAWGAFWVVTDPRLMSVAVMWLLYLSYLALRATIEEPEKRANFCAVYGVLLMINVPLVYFSIRWFGGPDHHPMEITLRNTEMVVTRWYGAFAFFVLYCAFWRLRYLVAKYRMTTERTEVRMIDAGM